MRRLLRRPLFWRGSWRWVLLGGLALLLLGAGALLLRWRLAGGARAEPAVAALDALIIQAPVQAAAGDPITVTVNARPPISGTEVLLAAGGSSGLYAQSQVLQDGAAVFVLPPGWTQTAGAATLQAVGGGLRASQAITIEPGAAANPLFTLTGPASTPLDGGETPMLLALPLDAFGNPVAAGAAVVVHSQPPAAGAGRLPTEMMRVLTRNLLAVVRLGTHSAAGILSAAASSAGAHSLPQSVRITPGPIKDVVLHATPQTAPAGGTASVQLATEPLADAYGNLLPDGVAVFFVAQSSDGSRRWLPSITVSGRAAAALAAPAAASALSVRALVSGSASTPITVTFTAPAPIAPFDLSVAIEDGAVTLRAGPLLTDLGALASDGSSVTFILTDPFGQRSAHQAVTQYGFAVTTVPAGSLPAGAYHVRAAVAGQAGAGQAAATFSLAESTR